MTLKGKWFQGNDSFPGRMTRPLPRRDVCIERSLYINSSPSWDSVSRPPATDRDGDHDAFPV